LPASNREYDVANGIISYVILRFALDTDVVVAAMRSPRGASAAILTAARRHQVELVVTVALALEYEAVCRRPGHRLEAGLTEREVDAFIGAVVAMAEPVAVHFLWRPQLRDAGDEMVLESSVNGRADVLVTFNKRDYGSAPTRFGIDVLLPREALERIQR
jgi:putative PIN family toxin of toxin-antitoxin system